MSRLRKKFMVMRMMTMAPSLSISCQDGLKIVVTTILANKYFWHKAQIFARHQPYLVQRPCVLIFFFVKFRPEELIQGF
ncbi:MAG: hypothetical protein NG747_02710 [Candidatus Brocadia sp.]|nr:hypothetical protein [Candidatus Brocadia sp.]